MRSLIAVAGILVSAGLAIGEDAVPFSKAAAEGKALPELLKNKDGSWNLAELVKANVSAGLPIAVMEVNSAVTFTASDGGEGTRARVRRMTSLLKSSDVVNLDLTTIEQVHLYPTTEAKKIIILFHLKGNWVPYDANAEAEIRTQIAKLRAGADKIILRGKTESLSGKIVAADLYLVDFVVHGQVGPARQFKRDDIENIEWDVSDQEFQNGMTAYRAERFEDAVNHFNKLIQNAEAMITLRALVKPYVFYIRADSLVKAKKTEEGVACFEKLINDFDNSIYASLAFARILDVVTDTAHFTKFGPLINKLRSEELKKACATVLVAGLKEEKLTVRTSIIEVLGNMGQAASSAIPALQELSKSQDVVLRGAADKAIQKIQTADSKPK
jgi:tetratricopeptide (TPR) repeat protein